MKISNFLNWDDSSKKKISLIALKPKCSCGLSKYKKIDDMLLLNEKRYISYRRKTDKIINNSAFGIALNIDFGSLYPSATGSHIFNKIKKISESISRINKFSKRDIIEQKKMSKISDTIPLYCYTK